MPSTQPEQIAPRAVVNALPAAQTEAVEPMVSFLASKSSSRESIACTDMHAAKMETSTQVTDVQTNDSLHFLGITSIILQKLCKHWGHNDRHWFSCGFSLQYMGPRLYQRSDYLHFNLNRVKFKIQKCFSNGWLGPLIPRHFPGFSSRPCTRKGWDKRLIHHLFYAENLFINDFIDPTACSVQCFNCYKVDQGAELKTQVGMGAKTTKKERQKLTSSLVLQPVSPG